MRSSKPATTKQNHRGKPWLASTALITLASIGGAVGIDVWMNGWSAVFPAPKSTNTPSATGPQTATGEAIDYVFGTVQLSVTRDKGKLTAVDLVQATANGGREQSFSYLQSYAIEANGSTFGNVSGATYTTDAFKQALDSAISKLG